MIKMFGQGDSEIAKYFYSLFQPQDAVLAEIRERSDKAKIPSIHVCEADGLHLEILVRFQGAKKVVEIGTLAGYSGVCIARALPSDGKLYTFEMTPLHADVARESFRRAGVADKIELFVGPALENLKKIESEGPFDLVFIDADKINYPHYIEWAYRNLKVGGAVLADNVFAWGYIVDSRTPPPENAAAARELRVFNNLIATDKRWRSTILPTGEGLAVAIKVG